MHAHKPCENMIQIKRREDLLNQEVEGLINIHKTTDVNDRIQYEHVYQGML